MSSNNVFQFNYVDTTPRSKVLKKTQDGWYIVNLGALNAFNSAGCYYSVDNAKELFFGSESVLSRKLSKGLLQGEMGHPVTLPGMTRIQEYIRNMKIDESRISHHIRNIQFQEMDYVDTYQGKRGFNKLIQVVGEVYPCGPNGQYLKELLEENTINVAFSIRSFTNDNIENGLHVKRLTNVVTYDWVCEPGIKTATKFDTVSKESFKYTVNDLVQIASELKEKTILGVEDNGIVNDTLKLINNVNSNKKYQDFNNW